MDTKSLPFYINGKEYVYSPVTLAYCMDGRKDMQEKVITYDMLIERLQEIKEEAKKHWSINFAVDIAVKDKGYLSVGLGENDSIISLYMIDEDIYLTSLGNEQSIGFSAYYFGDWTDISNKYSIPWAKALLVIKTWIETGNISDCINWTRNLY